MDLTKKILTGLIVLAGYNMSAQMSFENAPASIIENTSSSVEDIFAPRTDLLRTEAGGFIFGPATRIKFKIEEESGPVTTYFKVADYPFMKSDGRQMMPHELADGTYTIKYYSVDEVGNQEPVRWKEITVDKQGPNIRSGFNFSPKLYDNGIPVFPKNVQLAIDVDDENVVVKKVTVTINDEHKFEFNEEQHIDLTGLLNKISAEHYLIEVRAYDSFYNLSKEVVEFQRTK
ncbi:hypothetical protein [Ekhidna sp.]|uniref:hypothetical protein n=1 Tax=Ekhidna sp. TaxID=2608089 RepID=UPI003299153E